MSISSHRDMEAWVQSFSEVYSGGEEREVDGGDGKYSGHVKHISRNQTSNHKTRKNYIINHPI